MRKLNLHAQEKPAETRQHAPEKQTQPKNILEAFEQIVEKAEGSHLDEDFFHKAATELIFASRMLKLTPMQTALLAIFVDRSDDSSILLSEIATYVGCRTTKILRLADDVDALESRHYLRASRSRNRLSYRVPGDVLAALRKNQPYVYKREKIENSAEFFDRFNKLMDEADSNEITHDQLLKQTEELLGEIKTSEFVKTLKRYDLDEEDRLLLIYMAHLFVENDDDNIRFSDMEHIYDNRELPSWLKREFRDRTSDLLVFNIIENVNEDGMARSDAFKLTDKTKAELLAEIKPESIGKSDAGLIKADSLAAKKLIYNPAEADQIGRLEEVLNPKRFVEVQSRLRDAGMRPGFCCIFYGTPGTGKTETVYQIARKTGRSIMRVDVDKIKSCWVGESEKNIKGLFDRYRSICRNSTLAPILLFNEADAVLGVRMEGAARAVDKSENSIQNIILQEMESLEGIMIATTNLTTNLDKAFERRFLYKIRFDKPTVEARAEIWRAMLKGLTKANARKLASQFDLSGGEIENIVRKHQVNAILSGNDKIELPALIEMCRNERLTNAAPRIGF